MSKTLELLDKVGARFVEPGLVDLLDALAPEATLMHWTIMELEAKARPGASFRMLDLEADVAGRGKSVSFAELHQLGSELAQVINGVFLGCYGRPCEPPSLGDADLKEACDMALIAHDSALWIVHAKEDQLIERLRRRFRDTRLVP